MSGAPQVDGVELRAPWRDGYEQVLTADALQLPARLQREFGPRREELLQRRAQRDAELAGGAKVFMADFDDSNTPTFDIEFLTLPAYERLA